jgi:hypothetical protein
VDQAQAEYKQRRDDAIEAYVQFVATSPITWKTCHDRRPCTEHKDIFGLFETDGSTRSFRRVAAWLLAYKKHFLKTGNYGDSISKPPGLENAPAVVEAWLKGVDKYNSAGTNGDYDMGQSIYYSEESSRNFLRFIIVPSHERNDYLSISLQERETAFDK